MASTSYGINTKKYVPSSPTDNANAGVEKNMAKASPAKHTFRENIFEGV